MNLSVISCASWSRSSPVQSHFGIFYRVDFQIIICVIKEWVFFPCFCFYVMLSQCITKVSAISSICFRYWLFCPPRILVIGWNNCLLENLRNCVQIFVGEGGWRCNRGNQFAKALTFIVADRLTGVFELI